ncbi:hypothetical protein ACFVIM_33465 [Streptomyces sp. NPDC057638]|uniref:hypothetical protein n=1 Tax=Streptomyces sp. NPDC057638 TaxID=3346190 RepID=UPI0036ADB183
MNQPHKLHFAALTAAALGLAVATPALATAATAAAPAPAFLSASQLPAAETPWSAGTVRPGVAPDACTEGILSAATSKQRHFQTELETRAHQTITVAATEAQAKALVTKANTVIMDCINRLERETPGLVGATSDEGPIAIEEGARVYSLETQVPAAGTADVALYSVGRDGKTVTIVGWGQLGNLASAPLGAFKTTARTSVAKLY